MPLVDSQGCRQILSHIFPGLIIEANAMPSGQRLVYFCRFAENDEVPTQAQWHKWGPVVLKLSEDIHPSVIARLEKERELLDELRSPYYPRLLYHDVFGIDPVTDEKLPFRWFVTIEERIDGHPLSSCREKFRAEREVTDLLTQLTVGLSQLWEHPKRIVHRDLKPENILIRNDLKPVIIDLGIVREEGTSGLTGTNANIGPCTPAYASSEQLLNQKRFITFKADFFSLGVIAYELLTGANPFRESPAELIESVINKALTFHPKPLHELGVATPALSALVQRLLEKEPYKRPRTVQDLRGCLDALKEKGV